LYASSLDASASKLDVEECAVTHNATAGVVGDSFATVRVSNATITNNTVGLQQSGSGVVESRGGNTIEGNGADTAGTIGAYPPK
jgi:hypothetical protein